MIENRRFRNGAVGLADEGGTRRAESGSTDRGVPRAPGSSVSEPYRWESGARSRSTRSPFARPRSEPGQCVDRGRSGKVRPRGRVRGPSLPGDVRDHHDRSPRYGGIGPVSHACDGGIGFVPDGGSYERPREPTTRGGLRASHRAAISSQAPPGLRPRPHPRHRESDARLIRDALAGGESLPRSPSVGSIVTRVTPRYVRLCAEFIHGKPTP
jgi:hypothetical protein